MFFILLLFYCFFANGCDGNAYGVSTFAGRCTVNGNDMGQGTQARLNAPIGLAINQRTGTAYVAQYENNCIIKLSPTGIVTLLAGWCYPGYRGYVDNTDPLSAMFNRPTGVAVHPVSEDLFIADFGNNCIRKIAVGSGQAEVSTYVGQCQYSGYRDAVSTYALFGMPHDLAFDTKHNLLVVDSDNHCIRRVVDFGTVGSAYTMAGVCMSSGFQNGAAASALFKTPRSIAVTVSDGQEIIYIADHFNNCIRKLSNGQVVTFVGDCNPNVLASYSFSDGTGSNARFYQPDGIDVDVNTKNLLIVDRGNNCIRMASRSGVVSAYAGVCQSSNGFADGKSENVKFNSPVGISVNNDGSMLISDSGNNCVRKASPCDPSGFYNATTFECNCNVGYQINPSSRLCVQCNLGTFRGSLDVSTCQQCPLGSESSIDRSACIKCASNRYRSLFLQNRCLDCPSNSVCDSLGYKCAPGFRENNLLSICEPCGTGQYKNVTANTDCTQCALGFEVVNSFTECRPCANGTVRANPNSNNCLNKPPNAECSSSYCNCSNGFVHNVASNTCMAISSTKSLSISPILECPTGQFKAANGNVCVQCPSYASCYNSKFYCIAGYEYNFDLTSCTLCPSSMFKTGTDASSCIDCPNDAVSCNQAGFICAVGYIKYDRGTLCVLDSSQSNQNSFVSTSTGIAIGLGAVTLLILSATLYLYRTRKRGCKTADIVTRFATASDIELSPIGSKAHLTSTNELRLERPSGASLRKSRGSEQETSHSLRTARSNVTATRQNRIILTPTHTKTRNDANMTITQSGVMKTAVAAYEQGLSIPGFLEFEAGTDFSWGKYIAEGGGGKIFTGKPVNGELTKYGDVIVIKQIAPPSNQRETDIFYQEISIMYMLREHLNIAKIVGYSTDPYAILMKFYPLGSMEKWINSKSAKKTKTYITLFIHDICEGLKFMHNNGLAHADLKPANCLLDSCDNGDVVCVLSDFGITRIVNREIIKIKQFRNIDVNGASMQYASPETIASLNRTRTTTDGDRKLHDPVMADIYSIGVMLCRMLCRRTPWPQGGFMPSYNQAPIPPKRTVDLYSNVDNQL